MKKIKIILAICISGVVLCACAKPIEQLAEQSETKSVSEQLVEESQETTIEVIVSKPEENPSETPAISEPVPSESQPITQEPELTAKVPEGLQTLLKDNFLAGTAAQTLQSMVSDVVIAKEDWMSYQGKGVDEVLSELEIWGGTILRVDADNDGIKDLFMWIRDGGSSGNTSIQLAQGKEDGTYEVTEYQGTMSQELAFITYEGLNYLVETDYDYNRKAAIGFMVTCYEQGMVSDQVYLEAVAPEWEPKLVSCEAGYEKLAEHYAKLGRDGFHEDSLYDYRIGAGSGEWVEQRDNDKIYHADINNDGVEEWYEKQIFYPSTISSCVSLENDLYFAQAPDEPEYLITYYDLQYEGVPLNFWVEDVADDATGQVQHVVCLLTYEGLATNWVYGYLIEGEAVRDVFEIEYQGQLEWRN